MTPAVLEERIANYAKQLEAKVAAALAVRDTFNPHTPEWSAINGVCQEARDTLNRAKVVAEALVRYADPDFYAELPPSLALEDQGLHARARLSQAFPE